MIHTLQNMSVTKIILTLLTLSLLLLTSCSGRRGPDEYTIMTNEKLVIPKKFTLKKPSVIAQGPNQVDTQIKVRKALTGKDVTYAKSQSRIEKRILSKIGGDDIDSDIRKQLHDTLQKDTISKKRLLDGLFKHKTKKGKVLDPVKEKKYLMEIIEQECKKNTNACLE